MKLQTSFFKLLITCAVFIFISEFSNAQISTATKPNIVLIIGDDMSMDDFGCYGHPNIRTPNIDQLAAGGMLFTNAYLTTSQCSPTRCSVITGRYPHNTGAPELHLPLPKDQSMFPKELKKAGYYTVAAGKWHLGPHARSAFDRIEGGNPGGEEKWLECLRERPKEKPFFMWLAAHDAHRSWDNTTTLKKHTKEDAVIPPYMANMDGTRQDLAFYYDEIHRMDHYIGLVVKELKTQGVYENTIIMVMADNGRPFPRSKTWLYDSGIKTPFVLHWKNGINKPGSTCKSLISVIDIAPTVFECAGLKPLDEFQGLSFRKMMDNPNKTSRKFAFAEHNWHDMEAHERMVRWKNWVYIRNARPQYSNWAHAHAAIPSYVDLFELESQNKMTAAQADVFLQPRPTEMLFNMDDDYHQLNNLAKDPNYAKTLKFMSRKMDEWQDDTGDTTPDSLTRDDIDRVSYKRMGKTIHPEYRGTIPGSERNASQINNPGPR